MRCPALGCGFTLGFEDELRPGWRLRMGICPRHGLMHIRRYLVDIPSGQVLLSEFGGDG